MAFAGFDQIPLTPMRAHDSGIRVAVRPKQQMPYFMCHDMSQQGPQVYCLKFLVQFLSRL